jgi:hypothetical protein
VDTQGQYLFMQDRKIYFRKFVRATRSLRRFLTARQEEGIRREEAEVECGAAASRKSKMRLSLYGWVGRRRSDKEGKSWREPSGGCVHFCFQQHATFSEASRSIAEIHFYEDRL